MYTDNAWVQKGLWLKLSHCSSFVTSSLDQSNPPDLVWIYHRGNHILFSGFSTSWGAVPWKNTNLNLYDLPICNSEAKDLQLSEAKDAYACLMLSEEGAILTLKTIHNNNAAAYFFKDECSGMPASGAMRFRNLGKSSPHLTFLEAVLTFIEAFFPYHPCSADFMALHGCRQSPLWSGPHKVPKSEYQSSTQFLFGLTARLLKPPAVQVCIRQSHWLPRKVFLSAGMLLRRVTTAMNCTKRRM